MTATATATATAPTTAIAPKGFRMGVTRDGTPIETPTYTDVPDGATTNYTPDIWLNSHEIVTDGPFAEGAEVTVVGLCTVTKVCEYDGKRWAWIALGSAIKLRVYEGSVFAKLLSLQFDAGTHKPVVTRTVLKAVRGTLRKIDSGWTLSKPVVVEGIDDGLKGVFANVAETFKAGFYGAIDPMPEVSEADLDAMLASIDVDTAACDNKYAKAMAWMKFEATHGAVA